MARSYDIRFYAEDGGDFCRVRRDDGHVSKLYRTYELAMEAMARHASGEEEIWFNRPPWEQPTGEE